MSLLVDQYGDPILMYRGWYAGADDFTQTYWTSDREYALTYDIAERPALYTAELNLRKALYKKEINDVTDWNFDIDDLSERGYDAIWNRSIQDEIIMYVFYNRCVKILKEEDILL